MLSLILKWYSVLKSVKIQCTSEVSQEQTFGKICFYFINLHVMQTTRYCFHKSLIVGFKWCIWKKMRFLIGFAMKSMNKEIHSINILLIIIQICWNGICYTRYLAIYVKYLVQCYHKDTQKMITGLRKCPIGNKGTGKINCVSANQFF